MGVTASSKQSLTSAFGRSVGPQLAGYQHRGARGSRRAGLPYAREPG
jgi:hypothetical protein